MENKNTNLDILADFLREENTIIFDPLEEIVQTSQNIQSEEVLSENHVENDILALMEEYGVQEEEKSPSYLKTIVSQGIFLGKYILTSSFIFVLLLGTTNYSAYFEIAKSYLNPEALENTKNGLYASIEASSFEKQKEETLSEQKMIEEAISNEQKLEMVKNKNYHSMEKLNHIRAEKDISLNIDITPYENRIVIPKIGKNIPLVDVENKTVQNVSQLHEIFMKELVNGIVRYPGSAKPGQDGNSFIFGHSSNFPWLEGKYNDVFALLDSVVFGDEIIAYYDQKKYIYKVTQKKVIRPGDTSVLQPVEGKKQITLMTCWPVGTTINRMIVIGELVEIK